jgi:pyruvate/2-oxoacid:ferredoxin oxidoreductase alpha subunit
MMDGLHYAAGYRIPVVMTNANRETPGIFTIGNSSQDMWSVRDAGWIQVNVEDNQEILDAVIMAYRIAEDTDILLPMMVCYDGFYLSYRKDPLEIPAQNDVDTFLAPLKQSKRNIVTPDDPMVFGIPSFFPKDQGEGCTEFRYKHSAALERVKDKIDTVDKDFEAIFGRSYAGQIEAYRTDDADIVLVATGSVCGTAKVVVDKMRDDGVKVGLIKVRLLRPFPREKIAKVLEGKKGIGVIDRSVCFGYHCGHLYMELKSAIALEGLSNTIPTLNFIGGLANLDITVEQVETTINLTSAASKGETVEEVTWLSLEE